MQAEHFESGADSLSKLRRMLADSSRKHERIKASQHRVIRANPFLRNVAEEVQCLRCRFIGSAPRHQLPHIRRSSRYSCKSAAPADEFIHLIGRPLLDRHHVQEKSRVQVTGRLPIIIPPCRRETHRGIHWAAAVKGCHTRSRSKMRQNEAAIRGVCTRDIPDRLQQIRVLTGREIPVGALPPRCIVSELGDLSEAGEVAVEGGVKARYLRQIGNRARNTSMSAISRGKCARIQTLRPPQFRQYRRRYQLMFPQVDTAVDDTVSNRLRWRISVFLKPVHEGFCRGLMITGINLAGVARNVIFEETVKRTEARRRVPLESSRSASAVRRPRTPIV